MGLVWLVTIPISWLWNIKPTYLSTTFTFVLPLILSFALANLWQRWVALVWLVTATHPRVCDPRSLTDGRKKASYFIVHCPRIIIAAGPCQLLEGKRQNTGEEEPIKADAIQIPQVWLSFLCNCNLEDKAQIRQQSGKVTSQAETKYIIYRLW